MRQTLTREKTSGFPPSERKEVGGACFLAPIPLTSSPTPARIKFVLLLAQ
jgi:hypothetical protein